MEQYEIVRFRRSDGALLYGRISSMTDRHVTVIALGLKSVHVLDPVKVASLITELPSIPEMVTENIAADKEGGEGYRHGKLRVRQKRREDALRRDRDGAPTRLDYIDAMCRHGEA